MIADCRQNEEKEQLKRTTFMHCHFVSKWPLKPFLNKLLVSLEKFHWMTSNQAVIDSVLFQPSRQSKLWFPKEYILQIHFIQKILKKTRYIGILGIIKNDEFSK